MNPPKNDTSGGESGAADLRRQAEAILSERRQKTGPLVGTEADLRRLVHELEVHQIELEMQNEELTQARVQTEAVQRQFEDLYDFAPVGYFMLARDGAIRQVNLAGAELFGVERGKLIERRFGLFVAEVFRPAFINFLEQLFECREKESLEVALQINGQAARWVHIEASCAEDEEACRAVVRDVTERRRAKEILIQTEERFSKIFQNSPMAISLRSLEDGRCVDINDAYLRLSGFTWEELMGKTLLEIGALESEQRFQNFAGKLQKKKYIKNLEFKFRTKSGEPRDVVASYEMLQLQGEDFVLATFQDITERVQAEQALLRAEEKYRILVENLGEGVGFTDPNEQFIFANPAAENILGVPPGDLLGRNLYDFLPAEQIVVIQEQSNLRKAGERSYYELEIKGADGGKRNLLVTATPQFDDQGKFTGTFGVFRDITDRVQAEATLAQTNAQLRAVTTYWQNAIEAERAHISREIHDEFGQALTALKMDLTWLAKRLPEGDERVKRIHGMNRLVDESITLMRRIATDLRPNLLDDLGLNAALEWQVSEFTRRSRVPCKLKLPESELELDPDLITTLFRLVQESLTNVARHAEATRVRVSLEKQARHLVLTVHDNGKGFHEDILKHPNSLGLLSLRERAAQWGGETIFRSKVGEGTTVTVRIPLPESSSKTGQP